VELILKWVQSTEEVTLFLLLYRHVMFITFGLLVLMICSHYCIIFPLTVGPLKCAQTTARSVANTKIIIKPLTLNRLLVCLSVRRVQNPKSGCIQLFCRRSKWVESTHDVEICVLLFLSLYITLFWVYIRLTVSWVDSKWGTIFNIFISLFSPTLRLGPLLLLTSENLWGPWHIFKDSTVFVRKWGH
jgi:hypothetical protein